MNINNSMLISILPVIGKVFEKKCMNDLIHFTIKKRGFIQSSLVCLVNEVLPTLLLKIQEQVKEGSTDTFKCMLLDLRKSFESIDHEKILT